MSGMKVVYDFSKPSGSRVVEAKTVCKSCFNEEFEDLQLDREYNISMPLYLAQAGDGFSMFESFETKDLGITDLGVLTQYISDNSPIDGQVEGRITLKNLHHLFKLNRIFNENNVKRWKTWKKKIMNLKPFCSKCD